MTDASLSSSRTARLGLGDRVTFYWALGLLALAMLLGGGTQVGLASDLMIQLASLPLLVMVLFQTADSGRIGTLKAPLLILALTLLLPLLQLIPLPPALWTALPGRAFVVETYRVADIELPWMPISLAPHATLYSFFEMLPAAALFLACLNFSTGRRYVLLTVPLAFGCIGVLLGLAQLFGGHAASVSLYQEGDVGHAVGFFSNKNHFAALLYTLLPMIAAWTLGQLDGPERRRPLVLMMGALLILMMLIGLSIATSRAGVTLGVVAACGAALLFWRSSSNSAIGKWPIIIGGVVLVTIAVLLQIGLIDLLIERSAVDNSRTKVATTTIDAIAGLHAPFGTGFGTFVPIYMMFEPAGQVGLEFVNHAHNEWLELTLEGGLPAAILLVAFLLWFGVRTAKVWWLNDVSDEKRLLLARAASLSILFLLLHSLLDYPLRTTTLMCLFAVCCAYLCDNPATSSGKRR